MAAAFVAFDFASMLAKVPSKCVGFLLGSIVQITKEIREITKRTKANKYQCFRLSQRVTILVGFLQEQTFDDTVGHSIKIALINFAMFLHTCVEFMKQFSDAGFLKRLWNNKDDLSRFHDLHTEYSQHVADLTFSMTSIAMFGNQNKDRQDQQLKSIELLQLTSLKSSENVEYGSSERQDQTENIFVSGVWKYRYHSDNGWQDFCYLELEFDRETATFFGYGEDQLDHFILIGSLCKCIQTIAMTWLYTDDKLNDEHQQVVELQWDNDQKSFRGTFKFKEESKDETDQLSGEFEMSLLKRKESEMISDIVISSDLDVFRDF